MRSLFLFNNFHDCMFFIGLYDFRWSLSGRYFFCVLQNPSLLPPSTRSTTTNDNFPQALGPTSCIVVVFSVTTTKADIHRIYSFRLFWQLPWTNRTGEPEEWCNVGPSVFFTPFLNSARTRVGLSGWSMCSFLFFFTSDHVLLTVQCTSS